MSKPIWNPNILRTFLLRFAFFLFLLVFSALPVRAEPADLFSVTTPTESILPGESFSLTLTPQRNDVSAFLLTAEYDGSIASAAVSFPDSMKADPVYTTLENNTLTLLYASAAGGIPENAEITLIFRTAEDTAAGSAVVALTLSDAADTEARPLLSEPETHTAEISFRPQPSEDCTLLGLVPSEGQLTPRFAPDCLEYSLDVPFSCKSVTWETEVPEGASVRVNRKNLGAGGSTTDFFLTVTAADGKTRSIYTVHVHRGEKQVTKADSDAEDAGLSETEESTGLDGKPNAHTAEPISEGISAAVSAQTSGTQTVIPVTVRSPGSDPLQTAAIVLISAAAGMLLVLGAQHIFRKKDGDDR